MKKRKSQLAASLVSVVKRLENVRGGALGVGNPLAQVTPIRDPFASVTPIRPFEQVSPI